MKLVYYEEGRNLTFCYHFLFSSAVMPCLFVICLIFCSKNGMLSYKAQSQDEEALVLAAAQLHMVFFKKNASILGTQITFENSYYIEICIRYVHNM